jgi:threonyl-tRNA synthetase
MVQDDAHIFCTEDQVESESISFCNLLREVYKDFGFDKIAIKFSDRPEKRAGTDEVWDKAEAALMSAAIAAGCECTLNSGEGAFYGPKLEFVLKDAIGRDWQVGTLQMDFVLPERLGASYVDANGEKRRPVMLHRAIIGTLERFIGILIEHHGGKLPIWLSPVQIVLATVVTDVGDYANSIERKLKSLGVRVVVDNSNEKVNYKIRRIFSDKVPLIGVVGRQEAERGSVSLRMLGSDEITEMAVDDIAYMIQNNRPIT